MFSIEKAAIIDMIQEQDELVLEEDDTELFLDIYEGKYDKEEDMV